jgi:hypothetical protein
MRMNEGVPEFNRFLVSEEKDDEGNDHDDDM